MGTPTCKGSRDFPHVPCALNESVARALLQDFGIPAGVMTSSGSKFSRHYEKATVSLDCSTFATSFEPHVKSIAKTVSQAGGRAATKVGGHAPVSAGGSEPMLGAHNVLAAAATRGPCNMAPGNTSVWCDRTKTTGERVEALIEAMTLYEKANLISSFSHSIPRLNWPAHRWGNEALHGVLGVGYTSWPSPIGIAASFNKSLFHALGKLTSDEARAGQVSGSTYWAPNINVFRDPRWGRGLETPGEDPTLVSSYAVEFVQGMQGTDEHFLKVSACLKRECDNLSAPQNRVCISSDYCGYREQTSLRIPLSWGRQRGWSLAIL